MTESLCCLLEVIWQMTVLFIYLFYFIYFSVVVRLLIASFTLPFSRSARFFFSSFPETRKADVVKRWAANSSNHRTARAVSGSRSHNSPRRRPPPCLIDERGITCNKAQIDECRADDERKHASKHGAQALWDTTAEEGVGGRR